MKTDLREWQNVMFEAGVPEMIFDLIDVNQDPFLANKALILMNNLLMDATEENQQKVLDLLKENNKFFTVFFYIQTRIDINRKYLIEKVKQSAQNKFITQNIMDSRDTNKIKPNDFKNHNLFLSTKYDLEFKYNEMRSTWMEDELDNHLNFMAKLCENCFRPAQLFLKLQLKDSDT